MYRTPKPLPLAMACLVWLLNTNPCGSQDCVEVPLDAISWWDGDAGSNVVAADVLGDNDGVFVNGAGVATGLVDLAFSLDGLDDLVEVEDSDSLSFGDGTTDGPSTFECWIKRGVVNELHVILSKYNSSIGKEIEYVFFVDTDNSLSISLHDAFAVGQSGPDAPLQVSTNDYGSRH